MGFYVHLHVCFACDDNTQIAAIAKELLGTLDFSDSVEAQWYLQSLSERTGKNPGPKGGLSLWGIIGNHTSADSFVQVLKPFWEKVLADVDGGPCCHERIVVLSEREQSESATAHEIYWEDDETRSNLVVRVHERLPFSWMQF